MHVVLRGVDRCAIFFCDGDCRYFLGKLAERAKAQSVDVHAYVLMTNHIHLLMTPKADAGVSSLMKDLGQRYAQYVNRANQRTVSWSNGNGHLG